MIQVSAGVLSIMLSVGRLTAIMVSVVAPSTDSFELFLPSERQKEILKNFLVFHFEAKMRFFGRKLHLKGEK
jgi:hypothetical protein